jgi:hypothetical protein
MLWQSLISFLRATYPGRSPRADKGAGGVYTGPLVTGNSMAMGWLRGGVDLEGPENDDSSEFIDRGEERVPDSVDKFISITFIALSGHYDAVSQLGEASKS